MSDESTRDDRGEPTDEYPRVPAARRVWSAEGTANVSVPTDETITGKLSVFRPQDADTLEVDHSKLALAISPTDPDRGSSDTAFIVIDEPEWFDPDAPTDEQLREREPDRPPWCPECGYLDPGRAGNSECPGCGDSLTTTDTEPERDRDDQEGATDAGDLVLDAMHDRDKLTESAERVAAAWNDTEGER
jgi:hypothetical protein